MVTDTQALQEIFEAMDGSEWNADLWDVVASIIMRTGRTFAPFDPFE